VTISSACCLGEGGLSIGLACSKRQPIKQKPPPFG
jgi:hypothetical protein